MKLSERLKRVRPDGKSVPVIVSLLCAATMPLGSVASALPASAGVVGGPAYLRAEPRQTFVYPVMGPRISSDFGLRKHPVYRSVRHHHGIDLAAPKSAPIRAIAAGQVIYADPYAGYGNLIVVKHDGGLTSHYGHCEKIRVKPGQRVQPGAIIGTVGSTGISTGPHLHFEIRSYGEPQDPEHYLPGLAEAGEG